MKTFILFLSLAALLLSSCSILPNRDLNSARARWQNAHISHYRYQLRVGCFCAFMDRMPLTVEVANGAVKSMAYNDGTPVPQDQQQTFAAYAPIDKMFAFTADAVHTADEVKVEYDATYGYPASVQIDRAKNAADDELALSITNFERLP